MYPLLKKKKDDKVTSSLNTKMEVDTPVSIKKEETYKKDQEFEVEKSKCDLNRIKQNKLRKWREDTMQTLQQGLSNYQGGHKTAKALTMIETELASVTMILASLEEKVNKKANIQYYINHSDDNLAQPQTYSVIGSSNPP